MKERKTHAHAKPMTVASFYQQLSHSAICWNGGKHAKPPKHKLTKRQLEKMEAAIIGTILLGFGMFCLPHITLAVLVYFLLHWIIQFIALNLDILPNQNS